MHHRKKSAVHPRRSPKSLATQVHDEKVGGVRVTKAAVWTADACVEKMEREREKKNTFTRTFTTTSPAGST